MANEFRPFVMFTHERRYRSEAANTDELGLRVQYDSRGEAISWSTLRDRYPACNVLVGNSTVFGVGASSDRATISSFLQQDGVPCVNLSVRGATSRQELYLFQVLDRFLPPVRNIVIFSGVINISLAAIKETLFFPEFGAIFSEKEHFRQFRNQYERFSGARTEQVKALYKEEVDRWYGDNRAFRELLDRWFGPRTDHLEVMPAYTFEQKLAIMQDALAADLRMWGYIQQGRGCRVHFVMQPVINWTRKRLSPVESEIFSLDFAQQPSYPIYARYDTYRDYADATAAACRSAGISFADANPWLEEEMFAGLDMFTDICHLTDRGSELVAALLKERLAWQVPPPPPPPAAPPPPPLPSLGQRIRRRLRSLLIPGRW